MSRDISKEQRAASFASPSGTGRLRRPGSAASFAKGFGGQVAHSETHLPPQSQRARTAGKSLKVEGSKPARGTAGKPATMTAGKSRPFDMLMIKKLSRKREIGTWSGWFSIHFSGIASFPFKAPIAAHVVELCFIAGVIRVRSSL
jgi:hypothetical protein